MAKGMDGVRHIEAGMPIGQRIHVIGNSASGKSTLAARLAEALDAAFVEYLDALNWLPGWVGLNETNPDEFERRIREATMGERWVVAGSYEKFSQRTILAAPRYRRLARFADAAPSLASPPPLVEALAIQGGCSGEPTTSSSGHNS